MNHGEDPASSTQEPDKFSTAVENSQVKTGVSGVGTGHDADLRTGERMTRQPIETDYRYALKQFGSELKKLLVDTGLSVDTLLSRAVEPPLGLRRTQLYQVLAGQVVTPPSWDFVRTFVTMCGAHAKGRGLSVSTDVEYWRREHGKLTDLYEVDGGRESTTGGARPGNGRVAKVLTIQEMFLRHMPDESTRRVGVITADIRQVCCAHIWVNSENTEMVMPRVQEFSVSAIIRYEGSKRDAAGRVVEDSIADQLEGQVAKLRPVGAGEVFVTGAGELEHRNGVQFVVHAAAVYGEPGAGFRPVAQIGRCVENALFAAERLDINSGDVVAGTTILFPLLGTGDGGGDVPSTARTLIHAAINYLRAAPTTRVGAVLFLAYTDVELDACLRALDDVKDLELVPGKAQLPAQRQTPKRSVTANDQGARPGEAIKRGSRSRP